eukprot:580254-Pleurochrysis_carterae.AAC.1
MLRLGAATNFLLRNSRGLKMIDLTHRDEHVNMLGEPTSVVKNGCYAKGVPLRLRNTLLFSSTPSAGENQTGCWRESCMIRRSARI